jgi:hypothetical protein
MSPIAARVALTYRIAQRYLAAAQLGIGNTAANERVRVHRFRDNIVVTDLTNAGKRGKACMEFSVSPSYGALAGTGADRDDWLDRTGSALAGLIDRGYSALKAYVEKDMAEHPHTVDFSERKLRGVDVEPFGEIFRFKIRQPNQGHIEVRCSANEFLVTDHHWMDHPTDPTAEGHFQDTSHWHAKKADARAFYAWMKENHDRARRFMNIDMFKQVWHKLGINYNSH